MQNQSNHHENNQFWIGLFIGGLIGVMTIVLMGTEKGRKILKKLQEEGWDFWEEAKDKIGDEIEYFGEKGEVLRQKGKELIEQGKELEEKIAKKTNLAKEEVAAAAIEKADETLAHIEALQERGRQSTAELRRRLFKNIPRKS